MAKSLDEHIRDGLAQTAYPDPDACWLWPLTNYMGYGRIHLIVGYDRNRPRRNSKGHRAGFFLIIKTYRAHRAAWEWLTGEPVPEHMVLDHLCLNKACVNPAHLEIVTASENSRRGNRHASLGLAVNVSELPHAQPAREWTLFDDVDEDAA